MVSLTNKDFKRLLAAAYNLNASWYRFKSTLENQDSVEFAMQRVTDILVKYEERKFEEQKPFCSK